MKMNANVSESVPAFALPVAKEVVSGKVSSKEVLKAVGSLRAAIKEERRGANCTIRLIAERAAAGDAAAVDILCALCDVPRAALYSLNIGIVRAAVNNYYPFVTVNEEGRKINVRAKSVHYTTASTEEETQDDAKKRVIKGYYTEEVTDYLTALTQAAKARAKGQKQVIVDSGKVYVDNRLTSVTGVTVEEIKQAQDRKIFSFANVNVWHKNNIFGYYI